MPSLLTSPLPPPPAPPSPSPSSSLPAHHHQIQPIFPLTIFRPPTPVLTVTTMSKPEIRREALNGTGTLSAFYDSKYFRCNICKFKSVTSSILLQHFFNHIFFCHQCSFYAYTNHNLHQHIFEKHHPNLNNDKTDAKKLDLLYITRCSDGTFALCMDSSPTPPPQVPPPSPPPPPPPLQKIRPKNVRKLIIIPSASTNRSKPSKEKTLKPKEIQDNSIVLTSEKPDINPQSSSVTQKRDIHPQSSSVIPKRDIHPQSSSVIQKRNINPQSSSVIPKRPVIKEKQKTTYVLMKHRLCYSIQNPICLHSLTLEYNTCREHTIRHMSHTQRILKGRKLKSKRRSKILVSIDDVAGCLNTVVKHVVDMEENRDSSDLVCTLPNNVLNLIFPNDDLKILTNVLKLVNKYDKSVEQKALNHCEYPVRKSNQYAFILSSSATSRSEKSIIDTLHTSITNDDSTFTHTKLDKLPITYDNTHRFLKGNLNILPAPTKSTVKPSKQNNTNQQLISVESVSTAVGKVSRSMDFTLTSILVDKNNNSITLSNSNLTPIPNVIVLD